MDTSTAEGSEDTDYPLPTASDVAFYREHGYWISPLIVPPDLLATARRGADRIYAGDVDHVPPGWNGEELPDSFWGWSAASGDRLRKNDYTFLRVHELDKLVRWPAIGRAASSLTAGTGGIRLWHDQLLYKPVETATLKANVGWHIDRQYWRACQSEEMLTAWVPFHDMDTSLGPITFVDGSHRWAVADLDFWDQDLDGLERRFGPPEGQEVVKVPAEVAAGQVVFHHCRTIHGSGPNISGRPRRAIALHLQPGDNEHAPSGATHPNDELVRRRSDGTPDYSDPRVCPVLA